MGNPTYAAAVCEQTSLGPTKVGEMLETIEILRDIGRRCEAATPLTTEQQKWLAQVLNDFLAHRTSTIDEAMGLKSCRGGVPWWREQAIRVRDAALRELTAHFYSNLSVTAQARRVHTLALRYAASAWRFDRHQKSPLTRYKGMPQEWLQRAFASGAPMPIGERHLRNILSCRSDAFNAQGARQAEASRGTFQELAQRSDGVSKTKESADAPAPCSRARPSMPRDVLVSASLAEGPQLRTQPVRTAPQLSSESGRLL